MSIEDRLKELILYKYGSIRKAAPQINLPYSTIVSILRRGVKNCNGRNLQAICDALEISAPALMEGRIEKPEELENTIVIDAEPAPDIENRMLMFLRYIISFSKLDGVRLNQEEVELVNNYISMIFDIVRAKRFREEEGNKE